MPNAPPPPKAHTPGPWTAKEISTNHVYIQSPDGSPVANLHVGSSSWENARLIAAAPELLQRCKMSLADAEDAFADPSNVATWNWRSIADDLRQIIAKAEGQ